MRVKRPIFAWRNLNYLKLAICALRAEVLMNREAIMVSLSEIILLSLLFSGIGDTANQEDIMIDCNFPGGNIVVDAIESDTAGHWFYWYFRDQWLFRHV